MTFNLKDLNKNIVILAEKQRIKQKSVDSNNETIQEIIKETENVNKIAENDKGLKDQSSVFMNYKQIENIM